MPDIKITSDDVKKIAVLSKMDVTGQEDRFAELFTDTLAKIQDLNEVNTDNIVETFQVTGLKNVFQAKDFKGNSLTREEALSNAKEVVSGLFATKGVFNKESNES